MITDTFLQQMSKAFNSESFTVPGYVGFSSTAVTPDGTETSTTGVLDYSSTTNSRDSGTATDTLFTAVRSGTVASSSGDYINSLWLVESSTGDVHSIALAPSLLHTSSYDLEASWTVSWRRA